MTGVPSRAIAPVTVSSAEYARRHIAVRLLPFVFILYIINYLDRTSVAYAAIGMARDHRFDDRVFGLGVGVFFLSYVALQIPGAVLAQRWSARGTICASMIVSGFLTALTAVAYSRATLSRALFVRRGRSRLFPGSDRLSEPLVRPGGPGKSDGDLRAIYASSPCECFGVCHIELSALGQVQLRFDLFNDLLRRSSQRNCYRALVRLRLLQLIELTL